MDAQHAGALSSQTAQERVRTSGLRGTRQRITVLETLDEIGGHRTADELVSKLSQLGPALSRSTVFNVLDDLVEVGLVLKADLGRGAARFESAARAGPHHHFVCERCGIIEDVDADQLSPIEVPPDPRFQIRTLNVVFRGDCAQCATLAPWS